jgi:hypothetical protein
MPLLEGCMSHCHFWASSALPLRYMELSDRHVVMPFKNPHPLYTVWQGMRRRCRTPSFKQWKDYGGRGISVCPEWESFAQFVSDMGERPSGTSIERRDNDGNYEPNNCYWATKKEQQRNQRVTRRVVINGASYTAAALAEINGLKIDTVVDRANRGLSYDEVISPENFRNFKGLACGGDANGERQRAKTHCPYGHAYTPANTYFTKEGWRNCRTCKAIKAQRRRDAH